MLVHRAARKGLITFQLAVPFYGLTLSLTLTLTLTLTLLLPLPLTLTRCPSTASPCSPCSRCCRWAASSGGGRQTSAFGRFCSFDREYVSLVSMCSSSISKELPLSTVT